MTERVATVGEILEREADRLVLPPLPIEPGIYFGMPEEQYHSIRALSSGGVRDLLVSPLTYWVGSPFNPDREDEKTASMLDGTAFHRRLLEPEKFDAIYAVEPTKGDAFKDALDGGEALRAECERLGLKKSGTIAELCARILEANPQAQLWPVIEKTLRAKLEGRELLKLDTMKVIERAADLIFRHHSATKALSGGMAEVSIFWTDEETGVPMKIRPDYLKTKIAIDLKSFVNMLGRPLNAAIASAVKSNGYGIQAVMYGDGIEQAKKMLRSMKSKAIHNLDGREIPDEWIIAVASCPLHAFAFLFVERGPVTNVRLREYRRAEGPGSQNAYWEADFAAYRQGVNTFVDWMERIGPDQPWVEDQPMLPFSDGDF